MLRKGETGASAQGIPVLLLMYGAATLVHFIHNAEFLGDYPNMPSWLSRAEVYFAWLGLTAVGVLGWLLLSRGYQRTGFFLVAAYAALGMDSLGHYAWAPMSAHTATMNVTILLEVTTAALLFIEVARQVLATTLRNIDEHNA
jgi:hypothetical protein